MGFVFQKVSYIVKSLNVILQDPFIQKTLDVFEH